MTVPMADVPLVDQHCHAVLSAAPDRAGFEALLTEALAPTGFDNHVGVAIRRWCAPVLDLPAHATPEQYLARRADLGEPEVRRRLLTDAGFADLLVDTGLSGPDLTSLDELAAASGARVHEVVRLETVAERLAAADPDPARFVAALEPAVAEAARRAVACKSVAAYRCGLDLDPARPAPGAVRAAAGRWLDRCARQGRIRLDDPVLIGHLIWCAVEVGRPLQLHTGLGDADLRLHRADPLLLTDFLRMTRSTATPVVLLHCYPYHRNAGYLAHVFPHVYVDVGLAVNHVGPRAAAVLAETLELAPFGTLLFSSDGYGLPELHHLGAVLFRRALGRVLDRWVGEGDLSVADADRYAAMICADNARKVYRLDPAASRRSATSRSTSTARERWKNHES